MHGFTLKEILSADEELSELASLTPTLVCYLFPAHTHGAINPFNMGDKSRTLLCPQRAPLCAPSDHS